MKGEFATEIAEKHGNGDEFFYHRLSEEEKRSHHREHRVHRDRTEIGKAGRGHWRRFSRR